MEKHYPPKFNESKFHCVRCGVFAAQHWHDLHWHSGSGFHTDQSMRYCVCAHCSEWSYWHKGKMVVPADSPAPPPHDQMPAECVGDYNEAREVVTASPRAAGALLRLGLQKLMPVLGESGKNLNTDIANLVGKGLPVQVQQALDVCRVVGNNAVHPGEIDLNDTPEIAHNLFGMFNFIVEDRIARPKHIQALYDKLPAGAKTAIAKRDGPET